MGLRAREEKPGPWKPRARATARTGRVQLDFEILCEDKGLAVAHGKREDGKKSAGALRALCNKHVLDSGEDALLLETWELADPFEDQAGFTNGARATLFCVSSEKIIG